MEIHQAGLVGFAAWALLSLAASTIYRRLVKRDEPSIDEARIPTTSEGRKRPIVWGKRKVTPAVIWYGNKEIFDRKTVGIFGGDLIVREYKASVQLSVCQGEVDQISKIWVDGKRPSIPLGGSGDGTWDADGDANDQRVVLSGTGDRSAGDAFFQAKIMGYLGSSTQPVDSHLSNFQDPIPAYRNRCYMVMSARTNPLIKGATLGTSPTPPNFEVEVIRTDTVNPLGLSSGDNRYQNDGINPASLVADLITNEEFLNQSVSLLGASFAASAAVLKAEGNSVSLVVDRASDANAVLRIVERQTDGFAYKSPSTGTWEYKLARAGASSVATIDPTNITRLRSFKRSTWQGTVNQVNVKFSHYDGTSQLWKDDAVARAHDIGNFSIQGRYVSVDLSFPGCTSPLTASRLAGREVRARNRPLATAVIECDRSVSHVEPGDVVEMAWGAPLNFAGLVMRVTKVDPSSGGGDVVLYLTEDVFQAGKAIAAAPTDTGWEVPSSTPAAVPLTEGLVFESPYAIARRAFPDPDAGLDTIWCAAAQQTDEATQSVYSREGADPYALEGSLGAFVLIGTLDAALDKDTSQPTATPSEDIGVSDLGFPDAVGTETVSAAVAGQNLDHLVLIGDEFMLARDIENVDGSTFTLKRVYRGVLDTARAAHAMSANVYLYVGSLPGSIGHTQGVTVNAQFRPVTIDGELAEGSANTESVSTDNRGRRPYSPTALSIEGTEYPTSTVSLDSTTASGSGLDDVGFDAAWDRRDYRIYDEVVNATGDAAAVNPDFPAADSTEYRVTVVDDPGGSPTTLFSTPWDGGGGNNAAVVTRTQILAENDGVVPSTIRVSVETRHTYDGDVRTARVDEEWDFDVDSSALSGLDNTGARAQNVVSTSFTADVTDTYVFTIGTDLLTSGDLEVRLNGGGYSTVISSGGGTSGTIAVSSGDTVEWRHTQGGGSGDTYTHVRIQQQTGSVDEAYGVIVV